jgi:hypothetical protein
VIVALVVGTVLAVGALAFVLYPVFFGSQHAVGSTAIIPRQSDREAAVAALREIEFDKATGKLSDVDYAELKGRYTEQAIVAMRVETSVAAASAPNDDEIEAAVRAYREVPARSHLRPRPEPDAVFCSNCGRYLHAQVRRLRRTCRR